MTTVADMATIESLRIQKYKENRGVFLVHEWKPSEKSGQQAEVTISIRQHLEGPLTEGQVESVTYYM